MPREQLRSWRLDTPLDHFVAIRKKFNAANITIRAYNYSFNDSFTEPEIDRGFEIARALGAEFITASSTLSAAKRVAPFAEKHKMVVAMHNHSNLKDPNEFATPESFAAAQKLSKYFKINLDIGHFTAANFDAVAYIREHQEGNAVAADLWSALSAASERDVERVVRAWIEEPGFPLLEVKRSAEGGRTTLSFKQERFRQSRAARGAKTERPWPIPWVGRLGRSGRGTQLERRRQAGVSAADHDHVGARVSRQRRAHLGLLDPRADVVV